MSEKEPSALLGEAFLEAIRQAVREEIRAVIEANGIQAKRNGADSKPYLTIKEAADFSRIAPSTIRLYIRKRKLRAFKEGRRVIIKRSDLEAFLEAHPIEAISE